MNNNIHKALLVLLVMISCCATFQHGKVMAQQQQVTREKDNQKTVEADRNVVRREDGSVSVELERGGKITVDNRTTGRIAVIGWDKNTVEARASSERGIEAVRFEIKETPSGSKTIWLKADYAKDRTIEVAPMPAPSPTPTPKPKVIAPPTVEPSPSMPSAIPSPPTVMPKQIRMPGTSKYDGPMDPPMRDSRPVEVHLEVHVPRSAEIDLIKVYQSDVEVTNVETPLTILGNKSEIVLRNVGAVEVRTQSGKVEVENASGFVDVVTTSGPVRVRRASGDVRALSIGGDVEIECARGRVNVDNTDGPVKLVNVQGDVDATTSSSNLLFMGALSEDGRYYLKSMSGAVEMAVRDKPPGFTASLSSYRGTIENDFQLKIKQASQHEAAAVNRRIIGSYGSGKAQVNLDTFDGRVKLGKLAPEMIKECK
ncbi:MAG TPA: DUF4097 family beta strand repeat-containing protein [Pyrinomonadaceae bacterium]